MVNTNVDNWTLMMFLSAKTDIDKLALLHALADQLDSEQVVEVIAAFNDGIYRLMALKKLICKIDEMDKSTVLFMFSGTNREEASKILFNESTYIDGGLNVNKPIEQNYGSLLFNIKSYILH